MEKIGAEAFEGGRLGRPGTWAIAFLADWCPFCRSFEPAFEGLKGNRRFELAIADVTDESSPLWERFGIDVVPTILAFRDGAVIFRRDGRLGRGLGSADLKDLKTELEAK